MAELNSTQGISMVLAAPLTVSSSREDINRKRDVLRARLLFLPAISPSGLDRAIFLSYNFAVFPSSPNLFHLFRTNLINLQEMSFSILVSKPESTKTLMKIYFCGRE